MFRFGIRIAAGLLCIGIYGGFLLSAEAQTSVTVTKKAAENRVRFLGLTGSSTASAQVKSDLEKCGWFEVVSGAADFTVGGSATASGVVLNVIPIDIKNGRGFTVSQQNVGNERETVHRAVDKILTKLFNIKGICAYPIAFAVESSPKVKNIYVCDFDGSNVRQATRINSVCTEPEWVPGAKSIIYTLYSPTQTYVAETNLTNGLARRLSQYPGMNADPVMNPKGGGFALLMSKDGNVELYLRAYGGNTLRRLTQSKGTEGTPAFSPNGTEIAFISDEGHANRPSLYRVSTGGGNAVPIKAYGANPTKPDWSLDNKIAYSAVTNQGHSLCVTDLSGNGGAGTGVILGGGFESPSWAPDNRHVVCQQVLRGRSQLWVIDTWTGKKRPLIQTQMNASVAAWNKY